MSRAGLHAPTWAEAADTPLWLDFTGPDRPNHDVALRALQPWEANGVRRIYETREQHLTVALYPKCAADRDEVVRDLVDQIRGVREAIDAFLDETASDSPSPDAA